MANFIQLAASNVHLSSSAMQFSILNFVVDVVQLSNFADHSVPAMVHPGTASASTWVQAVKPIYKQARTAHFCDCPFVCRVICPAGV